MRKRVTNDEQTTADYCKYVEGCDEQAAEIANTLKKG
jgi:hypothetical protein